MLRRTVALRWLRPTPVALFEVRDVRERIKIERRRAEKVREFESAQSATNSKSKLDTSSPSLSDEALAEECGLTPPTSFSLDAIQKSREVVMHLVKEQREKRLAKRQAFVSWQAGQREKGAAFRLAGSAKKAERWQRLHASQTGHKILSTALHSPRSDGRNTNNDADDHLLQVFAHVEGRIGLNGLPRIQTTSDALNHANMRSSRSDPTKGAGYALHLTLGRGGLP